MFSQLRNAVEQLAQPIRDASSPENHADSHARSGSLDIQAGRSTSPLSSSELAESALSTLRKSLVSQRSSASPSPKASSPPAPAENARPRKSNLEERLRRATFAIGDGSGSPTPNRSSRVGSPSPMSSDRKPMPPKVQVEQSPSSTPPASSAISTVASTEALKVEEPSNSASSETPMPKSEPESVQAIVEEPSTITHAVPSVEGKSTEEPKRFPLVESEGLDASKTPSSTNETDDSKGEVISTSLSSTSSDAEEQLQESAPEKEDTAVEDESITHSPDTPPHTSPPRDDIEPSTKQTYTAVEEISVKESPDEKSFEVMQSEDVAITRTSEDNVEVFPKSSPGPSSEEHVATLSVSPLPADNDNDTELEVLQARLKQVEQRFSDVSTSFKRLQAEKMAADAILREITPVESIKDTDGLRDFLAQVKTKEQVYQDEVKRLNQKLEVQEDRIEEIRDTHRLESQSRSEEVNKLKIQLDETEALFQAAQRATSNVEENAEKHKAEIEQLKLEVEKAKTTAKEEEEKRVKAISLLKTVRQKLVKAEKEKDDVLREVASIKEREQGDKNKEQADRQTFQRELEALTATHEQATANLRAQYNKDFTSMQERYKQELAALRGQTELDIASAKSTYTKELGLKTSQIATLENSLNNVTRDKNAFFDQLQLRQAELESAQAHLESIQHQNTEFQFQLREANDRVALLKEECSELLREQETRLRDPGPSAEEVARMVSSTEAKYESKLAELRRNLSIMEKERHESESDWSRKLKEKVKELEDLKRILGSAAKTREADENIVANLKAELAQAQHSAKIAERQIGELPLLRDQINELEKSLKEQEKESNIKTTLLEKALEDTKTREAQLKQSNKVLREEMRKVQSSAALLERQRNPGVGYWTTRDGAAEPRTSNVSQPETPARVSSPTPSTAMSNKNEEEVNLEYLRNVILQFLEHKEMRPNLVKVLSIILHFTPQETRRLIAKV